MQLFMDSIELNPDGGITWWTEDIRQEFIDRKGLRSAALHTAREGLPQVYANFNPYMDPTQGYNEFSDNTNFCDKFVNDWVDVLTTLYEENMLIPLKEWLNSVGIETRAQISYGRSFEISEPSQYVDYPEGESLNMYDNVDILRLLTGGAHLQNKVLSTETAARGPERRHDPADAPQRHLRRVCRRLSARHLAHLEFHLRLWRGERVAWLGPELRPLGQKRTRCPRL